MSKRKSNKLLVGLVSVWFIACSVLIFWLSASAKTPFDPNMTLSQAIMDLHFEKDLVTALQQSDISLHRNAPVDSTFRGNIYHITQGDCYCEWLVQAHQNKIDTWSSAHQLQTHFIDINLYPSLAAFVPSTPAIAVVDANNKLVYFGPYSRGSGCFGRSGEVDIQLNMRFGSKTSSAQTENTDAVKAAINRSMIDVDASGCYCNT